MVLVVSDTLHLMRALAELRASMADRYIAISLLWRKEPASAGAHCAAVAVLQLASAALCLVVQMQRVAFSLPLQQFLRWGCGG